jgi:hypothetical protein
MKNKTFPPKAFPVSVRIFEGDRIRVLSYINWADLTPASDRYFSSLRKSEEFMRSFAAKHQRSTR